MSIYPEKSGKKLKISEFLVGSIVLIHLILVFYAGYSSEIKAIDSLKNIISNSYRYFDFEWSGKGAYVMVAALLSSIFVNILRRVIDGLLLGWPRFKGHNIDSLSWSLALLIFYGFLTYFTIGFLGEKFSGFRVDFFDVFLIAISTYILGFLVDLIDEIFAATYCIVIGERK